MAKEMVHGGEYRRRMLEKSGQYREEEPTAVSFFLLRFYLCLALFIGFCVLDYTKASIYTYDSRKVVAEIQADGLDFESAMAGIRESIRITKE